jgi:hypothetical protein
VNHHPIVHHTTEIYICITMWYCVQQYPVWLTSVVCTIDTTTQVLMVLQNREGKKKKTKKKRWVMGETGRR